MTKGRWEEDPAAIAEAERIYRFVGEYVVSIQWFEAKMEEMILLARGKEAWDEIWAWLAKATFSDKIDAFHELADDRSLFDTGDIKGWSERLRLAVESIHGERKRRNGLLHSKFLFDFLAIGYPVMRTNVRRRDGGLSFEREDLSSERRDEIMHEMAALAMELNMLCVQLLHVRRGPD